MSKWKWFFWANGRPRREVIMLRPLTIEALAFALQHWYTSRALVYRDYYSSVITRRKSCRSSRSLLRVTMRPTLKTQEELNLATSRWPWLYWQKLRKRRSESVANSGNIGKLYSRNITHNRALNFSVAVLLLVRFNDRRAISDYFYWDCIGNTKNVLRRYRFLDGKEAEYITRVRFNRSLSASRNYGMLMAWHYGVIRFRSAYSRL